MTEQQHSLDDELKQAQIDKIRAEAKAVSSTSWIERVKLSGGSLLGIVGLISAITQYDIAKEKVAVADQKVEFAKEKTIFADDKTAFAVEKKKLAEKELTDVEDKKKLAKEELTKTEVELAGAKQSIDELRKSLSKTMSELKKADPKVELIKKPLVYIQFQGDTDRKFINELRESLEKDSFNAPGAERIGIKYESQVKYFSPSDKDDAERLAKSVEHFFESKGCSLRLPVTPLNPPKDAKQAPPEVWLSAKNYCK